MNKSNDSIFSLTTTKECGFGSGKFRISTQQILSELKERGAKQNVLDDVMTKSSVLVADITESDIASLLTIPEELSRDERRSKIVEYAVSSHIVDIVKATKSNPTTVESVDIQQAEEVDAQREAVLSNVYTAEKGSAMDADESVIEFDLSSLTTEQLEYIKKQLGDNKELRTTKSQADMAKENKIPYDKIGYFVVDTISRTGKNSMRKGIRPKFLNLEAGEFMPSMEKFREFFNLFLLVPSKDYDKEKYSVPISNKAVYTASTSLQLLLFWLQITTMRCKLVMLDKVAVKKFLNDNPPFSNIMEEYEFPEEVEICIALFNAVHVAGHVHIAKAIKHATQDYNDIEAVVNAYDAERAELYKAGLEFMRSGINRGRGKDVIQCYKQLLDMLIQLDETTFIPSLTKKLKEARLDNESK